MRVLGNVDRCDADRLIGWIHCSDLPEERLALEVFSGTKQIGACTAGLLRPELVGKMGDGCCGFTFVMPADLSDQALRSIRLRVKGSNVFLLPNRADEVVKEQPPAPTGNDAAGPASLSKFGSLWIDRSDWMD